MRGDPICRAEGDGVSIFVRATPNARLSGLAGVQDGAGGAPARLRIKIAAPPDRGRANAALLDVLARALALPKSRLSITAGETDRLKTVFVAGDPTELTAKIAALARANEAE
jgi:hypothetical protein